MRWIYTILFFFLCIQAKSQLILNNYVSFPLIQPFTTFNWNSLSWGIISTWNDGGVVINNNRFTNTDIGTQFGSAVVVTAGDGMFEVKNSAFTHTDGEAVQFENFGDGTGDTVWVHDNFFANNKNGLYFTNCNAVFIIRNNQFINPHGARLGKGQAIQFNACTLQEGSVVEYNRIESFWGEGYTEDLISFFGGTSASAGDTAYCQYNISRGGGPSASGGGFICGDGDGSRIVIRNNVLKDPGNYVVNIAGGTHNSVRYNIGYQRTWIYSNNIATYAYITGASEVCSDQSLYGNIIHLEKDENYYWWGDPEQTCGTVVGVDRAGNPSDPDAAWHDGNSSTIDESGINALVPVRLITFVPDSILWKLRDSSTIYRHETGGAGWVSPGFNGAWPPSPYRPTANAGSDQSINISTATLSASGGSGGDTYRWVQQSGPSTAIMSAPNSASNNLSGLTDGTYVLWVEVARTDTEGNVSSDYDIIIITVLLT